MTNTDLCSKLIIEWVGNRATGRMNGWTFVIHDSCVNFMTEKKTAFKIQVV